MPAHESLMIVKSRTGWVGVDVGTRTVKLAQLAKMANGFRITAASIVPRLTAWSDAQLKSPEFSRSVAEIHAALELAGTSATRAAAGTAPMSLCSVQGFPLDDSATDPQPTVARQLAESLGEDAEGMTYDYWLPTSSDAPVDGSRKREAIAMTLSRAWSDRLAHDMDRAGLRCEVLDGVPTSLARAVALMLGEQDREHTLAVDWGYRSLTLTLADRGQSKYARSLASGGFAQPLQESASRAGWSLWQIGPLLSGETTQFMTNQEREDLVADSATELVREVSSTISYLVTHRPECAPTQVCLFGGGGALPGLDRLIESTVGLPTFPFAVPGTGHALPANAHPLLGVATALSLLRWTIH